jgi:dipeptidyl aminopeptidase/acylaminoacyl peptidase
MQPIRFAGVACLCLVALTSVPLWASAPAMFQFQAYDVFGEPAPAAEPLPYHQDDPDDDDQLAPDAWSEYLARRNSCTDFFSRPGMFDLPVRKQADGMRPCCFAHDGPVVAVAFAPDGKTIATGTGAYAFTGLHEGLVRLWEPRTGRQLRVLAVSGPAVTSLAFSPDGKLIAAASWDLRLQVWDVATGQERYSLEHPAGVTDVAFAPDGKTLAAATLASRAGYSVHLWDLATGRQLRQLQGKFNARGEAPVIVRYTPDGRTLAAKARNKGPISTWEVATGKEGSELLHGDAETFVFSPDGTTLAVDEGNDIVLVDFPSGQERRRLPGAQRWIPWGNFHPGRLAFAPDGRTLAAVDRDRAVSVWELSTGKERCRVLHGDQSAAVAFAPDGRALLTGSMDETARLSDITGWDGQHGPWPKELAAEELSSLWRALASEDGFEAHQAIWTLVRWPKQAVPFLEANLRPDPAVERRIELLIADLNSDQFAVRHKATQALEGLAEPTEGPLRRVLQQRPSLEVSRRIDALLRRLETQVSFAYRARRQRASEVLEQIGTPEARQALKSLGLGRVR